MSIRATLGTPASGMSATPHSPDSHRSRCPQCFAFISLQTYINMQSDYVFCRNCGTSFHVPSHEFFFDVVVASAARTSFIAYQPPKPLTHTSVTLPNGKNRTQKIKTLSGSVAQLDLFGGVL